MNKLFYIFLSYLIVTFICMDYNPLNWNYSERGMFICIAFAWVMLTINKK
jgi:hypothetical protein